MGAGITVFLADDNLIVRAGVRALLNRNPDFEIVGEAADYDELLAGAEAAAPQVLVSDIRMPPTFQREGIEAAHALRKRHPGTGVVILSQYDDPEYAISLLSEGQAGYAYLLQQMAEGRPIKAIAVARGTTPAAVDADVERLFLQLAQGVSAGTEGALRRLRMLHQAIVDREEQGETLSRLLPGGLADKVRREGKRIGETEEVEVTVLMSDIRGYSGIAEHAQPSALARQLNEHRAEMNRAIIGETGTVMQFVGDAVMAVFGAPVPSSDHADRAVAAANAMHAAQDAVNARWAESGLPPFGLGIGLSTGHA